MTRTPNHLGDAQRDQQHEFQLEEVTDQQDPRMVPALRTLRACLHPSASPAPSAGAGGAALQHRLVNRRRLFQTMTRTGGGFGGLTGTLNVAHGRSGCVGRLRRARPCREGRKITAADFVLAVLDAARRDFGRALPCAIFEGVNTPSNHIRYHT